MKQLKDYIFEAMQELYHFTNAYNLVSILKDDTWISSNDYNKELYVSTTRTKYGGIGYPAGMLDDTNVVRVVFDGGKLNSKFKIKPVDKMKGKWRAIKKNWAMPEAYDKHYPDVLKQENVESEDRVFVNKETIPNVSRYIKAIHINLSNIDRKYLTDIVKYCEKYGIELKQYKNFTDFNFGK
jgi:hypothetical protein